MLKRNPNNRTRTSFDKDKNYSKQMIEKYKNFIRDRKNNEDSTTIERYLQFIEHFQRKYNAVLNKNIDKKNEKNLNTNKDFDEEIEIDIFEIDKNESKEKSVNKAKKIPIKNIEDKNNENKKTARNESKKNSKTVRKNDVKDKG